MGMATKMTGWDLDYIRRLPLFELLQLTAAWLVWEGNDLRWSHAMNDAGRLRRILYGDGN